MIYLLKELKYIVPKLHLKNVSNALFNRFISCGTLIWGNYSGISEILIVKKKKFYFDNTTF